MHVVAIWLELGPVWKVSTMLGISSMAVERFSYAIQDLETLSAALMISSRVVANAQNY